MEGGRRDRANGGGWTLDSWGALAGLARLPLAWLSVGAATGMWWVGPWDGRCGRRGGPPFLPWS